MISSTEVLALYIFLEQHPLPAADMARFPAPLGATSKQSPRACEKGLNPSPNQKQSLPWRACSQSHLWGTSLDWQKLGVGDKAICQGSFFSIGLVLSGFSLLETRMRQQASLWGTWSENRKRNRTFLISLGPRFQSFLTSPLPANCEPSVLCSHLGCIFPTIMS